MLTRHMWPRLPASHQPGQMWKRRRGGFWQLVPNDFNLQSLLTSIMCPVAALSSLHVWQHPHVFVFLLMCLCVYACVTVTVSPTGPLKASFSSELHMCLWVCDMYILVFTRRCVCACLCVRMQVQSFGGGFWICRTTSMQEQTTGSCTCSNEYNLPALLCCACACECLILWMNAAEVVFH